MIIALDKYTGYMVTSSPNCMVSSFVAMEILCITNIGSISSKKIAGVEKMLEKCQIVIFLLENLQKYFKCTGKHSVKVKISTDAENKIIQSRELNGK